MGSVAVHYPVRKCLPQTACANTIGFRVAQKKKKMQAAKNTFLLEGQLDKHLIVTNGVGQKEGRQVCFFLSVDTLLVCFHWPLYQLIKALIPASWGT